MVLGQQSGPPASAKQVQELLKLLKVAGHRDFRDARGPMGFTQRQAAGKFTRDEAAELIGRLHTEFEGSATVAATPAVGVSTTAQLLRRVPVEELAAELQRRGWIVSQP